MWWVGPQCFPLTVGRIQCRVVAGIKEGGTQLYWFQFRGNQFLIPFCYAVCFYCMFRWRQNGSCVFSPRSQGLKYIILWVFFVILIFFLLCAKNALKVPFQHIESSFCVLYLLQGTAHTICIMAVCWVACLHEVTDWHSRCTQPEIRISVFSQYSDNSW